MVDFEDYLNFASDADDKSIKIRLEFEKQQREISTTMYSFLEQIVLPVFNDLSKNRSFSYDPKISTERPTTNILIHTIKFSREAESDYFDIYGHDDSIIIELTKKENDNISFNVKNTTQDVEPFEPYLGNFLKIDKDDFKFEFINKLKQLHFFIERHNSKG